MIYFSKAKKVQKKKKPMMALAYLMLFWYGTVFLLVILFLIICRSHAHTTEARQHVLNLPPSPSLQLPIIGHLHLIRQPLHRTLEAFALKHGPIISLQLGIRRVVVVSSPDLVKECFTNDNDIVFSNHPCTLVDKYIGYDHTTMFGAPYGQHWRNLRRLGAQEVLSPSRLDAFSQIRQDEVRRTLRGLMAETNNSSPGGSSILLRPRLFELIFNVLMRMLTGKRYISVERRLLDDQTGLGEKFGKIVREVFDHAQSSNPEDYLPFLLWIDYRGLRKGMAYLGKTLDEFYRSLLEEHRKDKTRRNTIIGHLLFLQETDPHFYTDQIIKGFITNMIIAGTDTSLVTIEWAMSLLLNHRDVMHKAKQELDLQVGHDRLIEEHDLSKLPYLRSIIYENFRMFPPGPLIVPRESSSDCKVGGYDIPRGTILLVNSWAIQHDPKVWAEPASFKPERFEGKEYENQYLMPFGTGRRACPGSGLGHRVVGMVLGSLIHCFEWDRLSWEEIDLDEGVGLTMPKLKPLEALCKPREFLFDLLRE